ncbi:haloacid dehalogenase type II [Reyranella sp. CPCC 100927]|uniref:haloacid dehalogenase type II n=1 Tax=Reyranella sp. CPCC 100927 TaxID=2599616 RepID=UPI0011B6D789|nr:haloacid dehalogenase type II [Reyranella sp. CPCC 100927]TWT12655.1 haloacid dehalogenase type II [Reyranella sp. CPCC 100927]
MTDRLTGIKACVFDAYGTLFDFNAAVARQRDAIGPQADRLSEMWRHKQISYTWLRTLAGTYAPFWQVTGEALDHCLEACGVTVPGIRDKLMAAYLELDPFPEVRGTLEALRAGRMKTAILSNGDPQMLSAVVRNAAFTSLFDALYSVDAVKTFKTDPRVYQLAVDGLGIAPHEICFLSSNGWDAHAAAHFGFQVCWINRAAAPRERLPGQLARELTSLQPLPSLVLT